MKETSLNSKSELFTFPPKLFWQFYLKLGIAFNVAIWTFVFCYLKFTPSIYTSKWSAIMVDTYSNLTVNLPGIGNVSSSNDSHVSKVISSRDPRKDYIKIANSPAVFEQVAEKLGISIEDTGEPKIKIDRDSTTIAFEIEAASPQEAQQKSLAFYQVLNQEISRLRESELERRKGEIQKTLEKDHQTMNLAQQKLADYQARSALISEEQYKNLLERIEELRQQQTELQIQKQRVDTSLQHLSSDLNLDPVEVTDSYILKRDEIFKQLSLNYIQANTALADLSSKLTPRNPELIVKKAELEEIIAALQQRVSYLLDRPLTQETLLRLVSLIVDPQVSDLLTNRAQQQEFKEQNQDLERQIAKLDSRLRNLTRERSTLDSLKHDVQVAKAVLTSNLAKLDLMEENIDSLYPPLQLLVEPSLPELNKPTAPRPRLIFLGGAAISLLVNTGLILLWLDRRGVLAESKAEPRIFTNGHLGKNGSDAKAVISKSPRIINNYQEDIQLQKNAAALRKIVTDTGAPGLNPHQQKEIESIQFPKINLVEDLGNGVVLEMIAIPGGSFLMGTTASAVGQRDSEEPQHLVQITSFFMGKYLVTQAQWQTVAAFPKVRQELNPNPSYFQGANRPIEQVSWYDAVEFCARLSKKTGRKYRLPNEAEWEYACRAETTTPFHFGKEISTELANYNSRSIYGSDFQDRGAYGQTIPVGNFSPNDFGLYDMHGQVWEWCSDDWYDNYERELSNERTWVFTKDNLYRVLRGGSWSSNPKYCRSRSRITGETDIRLNDIGFRVVCVNPAQSR